MGKGVGVAGSEWGLRVEQWARWPIGEQRRIGGERAGAQPQVVGIEVAGRLAQARLEGDLLQAGGERAGDAAGGAVLDREDVAQLVVGLLRPSLAAIDRAGPPHRWPDPRAHCGSA